MWNTQWAMVDGKPVEWAIAAPILKERKPPLAALVAAAERVAKMVSLIDGPERAAGYSGILASVDAMFHECLARAGDLPVEAPERHAVVLAIGLPGAEATGIGLHTRIIDAIGAMVKRDEVIHEVEATGPPTNASEVLEDDRTAKVSPKLEALLDEAIHAARNVYNATPAA